MCLPNILPLLQLHVNKWDGGYRIDLDWYPTSSWILVDKVSTQLSNRTRFHPQRGPYAQSINETFFAWEKLMGELE